MPSYIALRRLRISIATIDFIIGILTIVYYALLYRGIVFRLSDLYWTYICHIVIIILVLLIYVYSVLFKQFVHKYLRAFLLFAIAILWLYHNVRLLDRLTKRHATFVCLSGDHICGCFRSSMVLSIICGFLILAEIAVTLKIGPLPSGPKPQQDVFVVSPAQPTQPQYQQPYPAQYHLQQPQQLQPYPVMQQQQQQPYPVVQPQQQQHAPQFQTQEQLYQQYQQQQRQSFYPSPSQQQPYYQQQPHPYSAAGYNAPTPQVPGSMITATPQPGGTPVVPYPILGSSVAVSPVLPVMGHSSP